VYCAVACAGSASVIDEKVGSSPVPPDSPLHAAGVHRFTVWSAPDEFVNVTVPPAVIVVCAGVKQNVAQPGPLVATVTVATEAAAARARATGTRFVVVVSADVVVVGGSVVVVGADVEVVVVAGVASVVVVVGSAAAGADVSASSNAASATVVVVRRMIELPGAVPSSGRAGLRQRRPRCDTNASEIRFGRSVRQELRMPASVAALWRFPVKSMLGEALEASAVGERGLAGDRAYALVDRTTGKVVSGKNPGRNGAVMFECRAAFLEAPDPGAAEPPPARITLPDGTKVRTDDADVDDAISRAIDRPVSLRAGAPDKPVIDDEQISLLSPPGTFFDAAPVHVVTTASLAALSAASPAGRFDARRFRPNVVVAVDGVGFVENDWVDTSLRVGADVELHLVMAVPRCVMTTRAQDDLPADKGILQTVTRENRIDIPGLGPNPCVGVYGLVTTGGRIARGDPVEVEPR
jgi:hypothetical protein